MFKSKRTEQFNVISQEREMGQYLNMMLEDGRVDVDEVFEMFIERYPGEVMFFSDYVQEYLG